MKTKEGVHIPEREDISVIIGRAGFFSQFKITFIEEERKMEFKKFLIHPSKHL